MREQALAPLPAHSLQVVPVGKQRSAQEPILWGRARRRPSPSPGGRPPGPCPSPPPAPSPGRAGAAPGPAAHLQVTCLVLIAAASPVPLGRGGRGGAGAASPAGPGRAASAAQREGGGGGGAMEAAPEPGPVLRLLHCGAAIFCRRPPPLCPACGRPLLGAGLAAAPVRLPCPFRHGHRQRRALLLRPAAGSFLG